MDPRALAVAAAVLVACAGPDPRIERVEIVAPRVPGTIRVSLAVVNRSGGHGQVQIEIHLRNTRTADALEADRSLELDGHQRLELIVDIPAPEAEYVADARAVYPD